MMRKALEAPARRLVLLGLALSASLLWGCSSGGDDGGGGGGGDDTRTLTGRVTNATTGNAVVGAVVRAAGRQTTSVTGGDYTLTGLPTTGTLTVTVTATGFNNFSQDITDTAQTSLNISLVPTSGGGFDVTEPPPPPDFDAAGL